MNIYAVNDICSIPCIPMATANLVSCHHYYTVDPISSVVNINPDIKVILIVYIHRYMNGLRLCLEKASKFKKMRS